MWGLLSFGSIVALGCQTPLPAREPLDPVDPRPKAFIEALEATAASRTSLQGALRLSLDSPDLNFRRPQRLALRRPADLRVEVLGLFGQIAAILVTNGSTYQTFDASRGTVESGEVTPDLLWRTARVALQPGEAVDLLLGAPRPSEEAFFAGAYVDSNGGVSIEFKDERGRLRERFNFTETGELGEFVRFAENGDVAWEASFDDYRDVSGSPFAFDVRLRFPELDARASLRFDHATLDPDLADELFALRMTGQTKSR
jgi:hypothetical protein